MVVQNNIPALNSHRNLMINNSGLSRNLERLSSGFRINRAADDAAGLAISERMRGQIRGLAMAEQNTSQGINLIQTAEGGLQESQNILQRMRELAVMSANATFTEGDRQQIHHEIVALIDEMDRIASSTHYNGINLIDGTFGSRAIGNSANVLGLNLGTLEIGAAMGDQTDLNARITVSEMNGIDQRTGDVTSYNVVSLQIGDVTFVGNFREAQAAGVELAGPADTSALTGAQMNQVAGALGIDAPELYTVDFTLDNPEMPGGAALYEILNGITGITGLTDATTAAEARTALEGALNAAGGANRVTIANELLAYGITFSQEENSTTAGNLDVLAIYVDGTAIAGTLDNYIIGEADYAALNAAIVAAFGGQADAEAAGFVNITAANFGTLEAMMSGWVFTGAEQVQDVVNAIVGIVEFDSQLSTGGLVQVDFAGMPVDAARAFLADAIDNGTFTDAQITAFEALAFSDTVAEFVETEEVAAHIAFLDNRGGTIATIRLADGVTGLDGPTGLANGVISNIALLDDDVGREFASGNAQVAVRDDIRSALRFQIGANGGQDQLASLAVRNMNAGSLGFVDEGSRAWAVREMANSVVDGSAINEDNHGISILTANGSNAAISVLDSALDQVSSQRAQLGAMQNRLESTMNSLGVARENLTAAESTIRDVDMAAEMMQFTQNNILTQAAQAMLAQANQLPQGVLQLLR